MSNKRPAATKITAGHYRIGNTDIVRKGSEWVTCSRYNLDAVEGRYLRLADAEIALSLPASLRRAIEAQAAAVAE